MRKRQILIVALGGMIASGVYGQAPSTWEVDLPMSQFTVSRGDTVVFKTTVAQGEVQVNFTPSSPCVANPVVVKPGQPTPCVIRPDASGKYKYTYVAVSGIAQLKPQPCKYCAIVVKVPKKKSSTQ
jgi:hypothetical protein